MNSALSVDAPEIVVGAPTFVNSISELSSAPLGQVRLCKEVRRDFPTRESILLQLGLEHGSIVMALARMGIAFSMIRTREGTEIDDRTVGFWESQGCKIIDVPLSNRPLLAFPRDLALYLPGGRISLLHPEAKPLRPRKRLPHHLVVLSPYGEGGRVLSRRNLFLVADKQFDEHIKLIQPSVNPFKQAQVEVGFLPNPISVALIGGTDKAVAFPEMHLDRVSGLLEGKTGGLHLVLAPQTHVSSNQGRDSTVRPPHEAVALYHQACEKLGITLHIPPRLVVPLSTGFQQFPCGKVLMTGGDDEVGRIVEDIVGPDNLFTTDRPIRAYPAFSHAGLRCLIGEWPRWLIECGS